MDVARKLGGAVTVVKAQIHAGGRGKGRFKDDPNGKGGVRVSKSIEEVGANAAAMLGHELVTKQTGPAGKTVKRVYIEEGCDIKRELYLVAAGRSRGRAASRSSPRPKAAWRSRRWRTTRPRRSSSSRSIPPRAIQSYDGRKIAFALGLAGKQVDSFVAHARQRSTAPSPSSTARWSRSIRWSSPARATSSPSMPR